MSRRPKRFYLFDNFRVDIHERVLLCETRVVSLTPKAFDTLLVLVENNGHMLTKEELMERVWPDTFVEENNLVQHISAIRKALSEAGSNQKFIETVPRRGYRFVADVRESLETGANKKIRAASNERHHKRDKAFSRELVIIGRAIDFK